MVMFWFIFGILFRAGMETLFFMGAKGTFRACGFEHCDNKWLF